jgi:copper homeostasis protein
LSSPLLIEALAGSAEDCVAAERAGADRVELNAALPFGGLTPTPGTLAVARRACSLPLVAMLRPRPAGFAYSSLELATMEADGRALIAAGAAGLAFGILDEDGRVDSARCERLMAAVPGCSEWVFHRAFDLTPEPFDALERLIDLGIRRVLTKGQANSFEEGEALLLALRARAAGRIEILVPGVRPHNARRIVREDGFGDIHIGRFAKRVDPSNRARVELYFGAASKGSEGEYEVLDEDYVRSIRELASG